MAWCPSDDNRPAHAVDLSQDGIDRGDGGFRVPRRRCIFDFDRKAPERRGHDHRKTGIEERRLKDRPALEAHLVAHGYKGAVKERILRTVMPFARARKRGRIKGPGRPGTRTDEPDFGG